MTVLHERTHPGLDVPDCFGCKAATITVPASVTPTRSPGAARAADINATEKRWDRDMAAFKTLRGQGIQPARIDGCADIAARATHRAQIEGVQA